MPWANRAAISIAGPADSPHSSDATVKAASPDRNMRLRPMRSPRRPASSSRLPKAIRYAFTTQLRPAAENPSCRWMDGRATVTIVPSRMIIKLAAHSSHSASWRRLSLVTGVLTDMDRSCSLCHRRDRNR